MAAPATAQRTCVCARALCAQCKRQFVSKGVTGSRFPWITKPSSHTSTQVARKKISIVNTAGVINLLHLVHTYQASIREQQRSLIRQTSFQTNCKTDLKRSSSVIHKTSAEQPLKQARLGRGRIELFHIFTIPAYKKPKGRRRHLQKVVYNVDRAKKKQPKYVTLHTADGGGI
eukprot:6195420-Pleurochrysis_carterae.AAC.1